MRESNTLFLVVVVIVKSNKRGREAARHSERVPEREDAQVEANKKIKARKWIRK
jgi:hypothetical protein